VNPQNKNIAPTGVTFHGCGRKREATARTTIANGSQLGMTVRLNMTTYLHRVAAVPSGDRLI
jgi:hypothetical protein